MKRDDVRRMAALQHEILQQVINNVAPGGALIYAVCSVFPEEGVAHVPWLMEQGFTLEQWLFTRDAMVSMDGFFAVKLRK